MSTFADTYLEDLLEGFYNKMKIARDTLRVGNDSYQILCAIQDYGEEKVVITLANIIAEEEGIHFIVASSKASMFIQYVLNSAADNGYGKRVRNRLKG